EGKRVDARADVFALGVLLHELVTGIRPYSGATWTELLDSARAETRRPVHELAKQVPVEIDAVVARALRADPEHRYAGAGLVARDLEALLAGEPLAETPPPSAVGPRERRGGALLLALIGAVAVASPAGVVLLLERRARA